MVAMSGFYSYGMLHCVALLTDFSIWEEPSAFAFKGVGGLLYNLVFLYDMTFLQNVRTC